MFVMTGMVCLSSLALIAAGCTSSSDSTSPAETTAGQAPATAGQPASAGQVGIDFRSTPDPPASGDNTYEVTVTQPDGSPVTDATVTVVFSMPAMPSMGMPAMRSEAPLAHQGSGRYMGKGQLEMNGTWSVLVTASRGADEIGRRSFSVIAR
jgi:nitrogen fixation protein FixH